MFFDKVEEATKDPVFGLNDVYAKDPRKEKIYLAVGYYKNEKLKAPLMEAVRIAEQKVIADENIANYLPFDGTKEFIDSYGALVFGSGWEHQKKRIYGSQTVGGTGALRLAGEFVFDHVGKKIYLSNPTWANHKAIFTKCSLEVHFYPYYDDKTHGVDFNKMLESIEKMEENSILLLHPCCHNPTGSDLTLSQFKEIAKVIKKRNILPFFDFAYQGLGEGIEEDRSIIGYFLQEGVDFIVAASCSKNFSLYCQRVGALFIVCQNEKEKSHVGSQIKRLIRVNYSNPPAFGASLVTHILTTPALKQLWEKELNQMRNRIIKMRNQLADELIKKGQFIDYSFLKARKGMFSFCDLSKEQVNSLIDDFGIYMLDKGRINVAGLNEENLFYVAESILTVSDKK